jgi:protein TonB
MQRETKQSFTVSLMVHGGFIFLALMFLFVERWLQRPEPVVFELVSPAAAPAVADQPQPTVDDTPLDPIEVPDSDPIKPLPDVPDLPKPEPPKPKPEPIKKMSYEEWARQGADIGQVQSTDELQRYLADLRRRIQSVFQPSGSSLQAEAEFTVTADGRITSPRIIRSSGNPSFDQSALRTLQVARSPGPPPGNTQYTFSLTFRSE